MKPASVTRATSFAQPRGRAHASIAGALDWQRDGAEWPNRAFSRFVKAGGLRWHVQVMGDGPPLLLLHGTGASTHSWRDVAPRLAQRFTVVAPDLPGHAYTEMPADRDLSLPAMARAMGALLDALHLQPCAATGHSAGAAIAVRMALDGQLDGPIVSINGAFLPFRGAAGVLFSPLARLLAATPWVPRVVSWHASDTRAVRRLIASTGSDIGATGEAFYTRLMQSPAHVDGLLTMMAAWDLGTLERDLPRLQAPLLLLVGAGDTTVQPVEATLVQARAPHASRQVLDGCGHLAHEEAPERVAREVLSFLRAHGAAG